MRRKSLLSFYLLLFMTVTVAAKEPNVMILHAIHSNTLLHFRYAKKEYICRQYGVIGLDRLFAKKNIKSICKRALEEFIVANPKLYRFAEYTLHREQMYRVDVKKDGSCLLYAFGKRSYSEELLAQGLAIREPFFKDEEHEFYFYKAYRYAKQSKKGIWSDPRLRVCIAELYSE